LPRVGWSGSLRGEQLRTELVADALTNAVAARDPAAGMAFLDQPQTLASALDGVRAIYLVARSDQVATMVTAARHAGVQHIVRQSTMEAGFDPPLGPGRWHRTAELTIERSGLAWTHLRPPC
jgi:uncharacterized protein YbjT (DUF2867 family)